MLCLTGIDSLWVGHLSEPGVNRVAWEYLGCSYLLAKEMEKFKIFLSHAGRFLPGQSLPVHFQEAALVLATEDGSDSEIFRAYDLERGFKNYLVDSRGVIVAKNVTTSELASFLN